MDEQIDEEITPLPEVDLDALLNGIITKIKGKFPALKTVDDYVRVQEALTVPAVAIEITGIESDGNGDCGTEQFAAILTFSAYCIVSYKAEAGQKGQRRSVSLAGQIAALVKTETWGCPVGLAKEINAVPDYFRKKTKVPEEYYCFRVDWQHEALLGVSVWDEFDALSETQGVPAGPEARIFVGMAPNIGPDHVNDYEQVSQMPTTGPLP